MNYSKQIFLGLGFANCCADDAADECDGKAVDTKTMATHAVNLIDTLREQGINCGREVAVEHYLTTLLSYNSLR